MAGIVLRFAAKTDFGSHCLLAVVGMLIDRICQTSFSGTPKCRVRAMAPLMTLGTAHLP